MLNFHHLHQLRMCSVHLFSYFTLRNYFTSDTFIHAKMYVDVLIPSDFIYKTFQIALAVDVEKDKKKFTTFWSWLIIDFCFVSFLIA